MKKELKVISRQSEQKRLLKIFTKYWELIFEFLVSKYFEILIKYGVISILLITTPSQFRFAKQIHVNWEICLLASLWLSVPNSMGFVSA